MRDNPPSYYEVLNISPMASDEDVKRAYRKLARRYHPDLNPEATRHSKEHFCIINEAYAHLKTNEKRKHYNKIIKINAGNDNARKSASWITELAYIFKNPKNRV